MIHQKEVKSILNTMKKRDDWFLVDYSLNPYLGCSCNCLYCYIRGSKYGVNMEEGLSAKINMVKILERQLANKAKKSAFGFVAVGSATDAYMPHETEWRLTEASLELLLKYRFPVFISTKRRGIIRDLKLLKAIRDTANLPPDLIHLKHGVILSVSISSLDENITNMLEPGAIPPSERLQLVKELKEEGFLVGVNAIPILPFISDNDEELEKIILAARENQADYILIGGLTLFGNEPADSKTLYYKFLQRYYPNLIPAYEKLYAGKFYPPFSYQRELKQRSEIFCKKHGIRNQILPNL